MGVRSRRFVIVVDDLKVKTKNLENGGEFSVSTIEDLFRSL